ncbi:MAG: hypothetical protein MRY77_01650 [Rhodobacteraceae bacterium]|nr:hypothetical protein [Paracoccaceae bacterium]
MRNDAAKWTPFEGVERPEIEVEGVRMSAIADVPQVLVSGSVADMSAAEQFEAAVGWPDIAEAGSYRLRARRDRVMIVNGPAVEDGWDEARSLAVSNVSGAFAIIELTGPKALDVLRRGTELSLEDASGSVARSFHGYPAFIYRYHDAETYRIHVRTPMMEGFWGLLSTFLQRVNE